MDALGLPLTYLPALVAIGALILQFVLAFYLISSLRTAARERRELDRELFGLSKKIEGLTASRREQVLTHYDRILQELAIRLPAAVASETAEFIFDTESKILTRLAELEPSLKDDEESRKKMDELIKSMERLEGAVVKVAAESVRKALLEGRRSLVQDEQLLNLSVAA